jgi:hypothetical protein
MKKNQTVDFRVGCSPITKQIFAGKVLKNGLWSETKYDVTDTAVGAVAQHLLDRNEKFCFSFKNGKKYEMEVKEIVEVENV